MFYVLPCIQLHPVSISVLSANVLVNHVSETGVRSFKNNENSNEPKIDPCRTTLETSNRLKKLSSTATKYMLFL